MKENVPSAATKLKLLLLGLASACPLASQALPWLTTAELSVSATMAVPSSNYNPRIVDGYNYVSGIGNGSTVPANWGRYAAGSSTASMLLTASGTNDQRMTSPLGGAGGSTYVLGAGGVNTYSFTRYDWATGANAQTVTSPAGANVSNATFGWVDSDTIVANTYQQSANRNRLYLMDVVANPFSMSLDTTNAGFGGVGFKDTSASYIRAVTVGSSSGAGNGYAYYGTGLAGGGYNPNFYALNLSTGAETLLGNWGSNISGTAYAGIWTVVAQDGYLYVQTTNDGIQVFNMTDATTLGSLYTTYTQAQLNALTGTASYYGFDVSSGLGARMLLSSSGATWELSTVPEPAAIALLGLGLLLAVRRPRKS